MRKERKNLNSERQKSFKSAEMKEKKCNKVEKEITSIPTCFEIACLSNEGFFLWFLVLWFFGETPQQKKSFFGKKNSRIFFGAPSNFFLRTPPKKKILGWGPP